MTALRVSHLLILPLLAACGGGGGSTGAATFPNTNSTGSVVISAASLDSITRSTDGLTGALNTTGPGELQIGTLSTTVGGTGTDFDLDGGGQIVFTAANGNVHSVFYEATPAPTGNRTIGVMGVMTDQAALPTGTPTYSGVANVVIQDGSTIYDLSGLGTIAADLGSGEVTTTATNLSGTSAGGTVNNVATITFTGSTLSTVSGGENLFSGGTPTLTSTEISAFSGSPASSLDGAIFGPAGEEAGAVFIIDDSTSGSVTVFATMLAK